MYNEFERGVFVNLFRFKLYFRLPMLERMAVGGRSSTSEGVVGIDRT